MFYLHQFPYFIHIMLSDSKQTSTKRKYVRRNTKKKTGKYSILHIYHYNEVINQILHYIIEKTSQNMRKTSNKKHSRGGKFYFMFLSFIKKQKVKFFFSFFYRRTY